MEKRTKTEEKKLKKILNNKPYLSVSLREMNDKDRDEYINFLLKENTIDHVPSLSELHEIYKDLLYIENTDRIDVVLAVALSRKLEGVPIWLILVGPSGDMKSVQINSIKLKDSILIPNLTSKTLVNGYQDKLEHPDLAPELDGKLILIPDMAQILKLPPNEKAELWGQLRDLYDGIAGKFSGQGSRSVYEGIKTTLIAGSTPAIDSQILIHQDLGTRELIYRTEGNVDKIKLMQKCFDNEELELKIKNALINVTSSFLDNQKITRKEIDPRVFKEIMDIGIYISLMRATAEIDSYTSTLRNEVVPEEPTRIIKQLKRIYICLKSLDEDYTDDKALKILWHIGKSSIFPLRNKILTFLLDFPAEYSTSQIAQELHIGKSTTQRELAVLWNLKLVKCRPVETKFPDKFYDYWELNDDHFFVKKLKLRINEKNEITKI